MVRILSFHRGDLGSIPGWEAKNPHTMQPGQKKKKEEEEINLANSQKSKLSRLN